MLPFVSHIGSMLSLILPPIVLVLALAVLVYFFSRRLPALEARIRRGEVVVDDASGQHVWRDRAQVVLLGVLEKMTRRFKVMLLRAHNTTHSVTDSLRKRREASRDRLVQNVNDQQDDATHPSVSAVPDVMVDSHEEIDLPPEQGTFLEDMPSSQDRHGTVVSTIRPARSRRTPSLRPSRPGATRLVPGGHPSESDTKSKGQLEELLIERIISNPRDIEAYERLGDYYLERDNYIDAKECYRQVLKLSPVNRLVKIKIRRLERILEKR